MISLIKSVVSKKEQKEGCKYLIVPDLHGTHSIYQKIEKLIKEEIEEDRIIIFLGDYMDRGERGIVYGKSFKDAGSFHVLKDLMDLKIWAKENRREVIFLRGNHEIFYEDYFLRDNDLPYAQYAFFRKSVDALEHAFELKPELQTSMIDFLKNLKPYYYDKENKYLFVHAGIDPKESSLSKQAKSGMIYWVRGKFIFSEKRFDYTVVFGHTPFDKPFLKVDRIGLDSGIYQSGYINLLKIDDQNSKIIAIRK